MTENQIEDAFCRKLEFGTGGLCGIMELGTSRMNVYTVRCAAQGLAGEILDLGEAAADYKHRGMTLYDGLMSLYEKYGFCVQKLETLALKGIDGSEKIKEMMHKFRSEKISFEVTRKLDYKGGLDGLPKVDVLKFILHNGWFAVLPSGTEPEIKFYFEVFADSDEKTKCDIQMVIKYMR